MIREFLVKSSKCAWLDGSKNKPWTLRPSALHGVCCLRSQPKRIVYCLCIYQSRVFPPPDVPDAPEDLMLSELSGKSVKLKWIPGDDHNSSTTGNWTMPWTSLFFIPVAPLQQARAEHSLVMMNVWHIDTFPVDMLHYSRGRGRWELSA